MATRSSTTAGPPLPADASPVRTSRPARWPLPVALLAVAITFGIALVRVLTGLDESFRYGGDQAMAGLAVDEASTLDRDLGPYSRYGWSHPGPLWFYLLAPATRLLGGDDAALIAATVLLNGLLAAAVVVIVSRVGRPALTLTVTALVLAFVLRMPGDMFLDAWSPYALLMGTLLFLVLAARARSGSWAGLLAVLVAGSFLVQTHVGSAPLVVIVSTVAGVAAVLAHRARRRAAPPAGAATDGTDGTATGEPWFRRHRRTVAAAVVLGAVWLPPVVQQLSSPLKEGNVVRLVAFFLFHEDGAPPTVPEAVVAVGRLLSMTPLGWTPGPLELDVDRLPLPVVLVLVGQLLASAGLVLLGRHLGSPSGLWWGVVTLAALGAGIVSAATVTGDLFWYLIVWVAVLPVATAIGYAHLLLAPRTAGPGGRAADRAPVLAGLAVLVLAGSVAAAVSLGDGLTDLPDSPEVAEASRLVTDALTGVEGRTVHVDMDPHELWPVGAGVVRGLVSQGWSVTVDPEFTDLFGARRASEGGGPVDVLLVATDSPEHDRLAGEADVRELGALDTRFGRVSVLIRLDR